MTATHTPGPWEVAPSSNPKNGASWRDIVSTGAAFSPSYVGEALEQDARLIAAAPDLLHWLRQCEHAMSSRLTLDLPLTEGEIWLLDHVRAAISSATG